MAIRVKLQGFIQHYILVAAALLTLSGSSVANVVVDWNAIAVDAPPPTVVGPAHGRILGYVHAAIYDAVNGIDRHHASYAVTAPALQPVLRRKRPQPRRRMASWCGSTLRSRRRSMRPSPNRCRRFRMEPRRLTP